MSNTVPDWQLVQGAFSLKRAEIPMTLDRIKQVWIMDGRIMSNISLKCRLISTLHQPIRKMLLLILIFGQWYDWLV